MSQIAKFYAGRSVFLTGGSGFVGKQVIEKLLRSCPEIDRIYLLMRTKKGHNPQRRLNQTLQSPIFNVIRETQPNFGKKVIPVAGDVLLDSLGISDADHNQLSANVSVVFHSAATLSFVEPLRVAVDMNVLGVQRMLNVCKQLPQLKSLVHISTAYSQVDKLDQVIEEKIYDTPITPEKIIAMTRLMSDDEIAALLPHLLRQHNRPNTYTLTKAIAEKLISQERGNLPVCIVRPSIITASQAEPFPGWVDNFAAANGVFAAFGTGTLRCTFSQPRGRNRLDLVPVDRVANALIAVGHHTAVNRPTCENNDVPVYNLISQGRHTMLLTTSLMLKNSRKYPFSKLHPSRYSLTGFPSTTNMWPFYRYLNEVYLPLRFHVMDFILALSGKKPSLVKMHEKSMQLKDVLMFFTSNGFVWGESGAKSIYDQMNDVDKQIFNCKMQLDDMDSETYYYNWWQGLKLYALKDPVSLKKAQLLSQEDKHVDAVQPNFDVQTKVTSV